MAEVVPVAQNDTITKILMEKRGLKSHEVHSWLGRVRELNPHITNLDRIYPGERILIPDTLHEAVSRDKIWDNALSRVPPSLTRNDFNNHTLYIPNAGETIDNVAERMFAETAYGSLPHSTKRAILIHNNPELERYLITNRLPAGMINITPAKFSGFANAEWQIQGSPFLKQWDRFDSDTKEMYQDVGPDDMYALAALVEQLRQGGASVGLDDVIKATGYGAAGISGAAASGSMGVGQANALAEELYAEAMLKFGREVVSSKKLSHLAQMERFLKGHPKYGQLMSRLRELPKIFLPTGNRVPSTAPNIIYRVARHFRKQFVLANLKPNAARWMSTIGSQLNGRPTLLRTINRGATWWVPAVLGGISVATAPEGRKVRTLFEEGFGVVGGAIGTTLGAVGCRLLVASLLGLGSGGMFIVVFIGASAVGIVGYELSKGVGGGIYDWGAQVGGGQIYHSLDDFVGVF